MATMLRASVRAASTRNAFLFISSLLKVRLYFINRIHRRTPVQPKSSVRVFQNLISFLKLYLNEN